jgi:hypothetical protein
MANPWANMASLENTPASRKTAASISIANDPGFHIHPMQLKTGC